LRSVIQDFLVINKPRSVMQDFLAFSHTGLPCNQQTALSHAGLPCVQSYLINKVRYYLSHTNLYWRRNRLNQILSPATGRMAAAPSRRILRQKVVVVVLLCVMCACVRRLLCCCGSCVRASLWQNQKVVVVLLCVMCACVRRLLCCCCSVCCNLCSCAAIRERMQFIYMLLHTHPSVINRAQSLSYIVLFANG
jgi:hypothetical protein